MTRTVPGKHAMGSLRLDEFDLDDGRARLIHAGHTAARHRFQGEQRHCCGAVACGRGSNVHLIG